MTARPKNEPIGEVPCPVRDCTETAKVYRFRARTEGRTPRFAGKVYADCPVHGRYGADGRQAAQEYILEKATIWAPAEKPVAPAAPETPARPAAAPKPQHQSVTAKPAAAPATPEKAPWYKGLKPLIE